MGKAVTILMIGLLLAGLSWFAMARFAAQQVAHQITETRALSAVAGPVTGFPLAFQLQLEDVRLASTDQRQTWRVPQVALHSPAWSPGRIAVDLSPEQTLVIWGRTHTITAEAATGQVHLGPDRQLRLGEVQLRAATLSPPLLASQLDGLSARLTQDEGAQYRLSAVADDLVPQSELVPAGRRDDRVQAAFEADLTFRDPLRAGEPAPALAALHAARLQIDWGALGATVTADLDINAEGGLDGDLAVRMTDAGAWFGLLVEAALLDRDAAQLVLSMLPRAGTATLEFSVSDSVLLLGPFPLAELPRF